ncbi:MAG: hypothetical protein CL804_09595 [Citromicrobium sp.]|nr:hypothetical protein [Citromicrobium sp.]
MSGDDYEVGYGKPPRASRWPKGVSGNPAGRPKNARGLKTDLRAELVSRMDIKMNGERVSGTKQQLMLRTLTARAASGDVRATRILIDLVMQVFGPEDHADGKRALSPQDQQILDQVLSRKGAEGDDPTLTSEARPLAPDAPLPQTTGRSGDD